MARVLAQRMGWGDAEALEPSGREAEGRLQTPWLAGKTES